MKADRRRRSAAELNRWAAVGTVMRVPAVTGIIDRRVLVNFRVDPEILSAVVPRPFRPKLAHDTGVAGVCLIRLAQIRPRGLPSFLGMSSENAAHRIAVEWDSEVGTREGAFVPRRDTSSRLNVLAGGRLFPGVHHLADFEVRESRDVISVSLRSRDGKTALKVQGKLVPDLPDTSIFTSLQEASDFFESGSLGYSATGDEGRFDGLELRSFNWSVAPLQVDLVESSFFSDTSVFPEGSVCFDSALLMRGIRHEWLAHDPICCSP